LLPSFSHCYFNAINADLLLHLLVPPQHHSCHLCWVNMHTGSSSMELHLHVLGVLCLDVLRPMHFRVLLLVFVYS
jgi:hypothetical protein